jgi:hypothetical protein
VPKQLFSLFFAVLFAFAGCVMIATLLREFLLAFQGQNYPWNRPASPWLIELFSYSMVLSIGFAVYLAVMRDFGRIMIMFIPYGLGLLAIATAEARDEYAEQALTQFIEAFVPPVMHLGIMAVLFETSWRHVTRFRRLEA